MLLRKQLALARCLGGENSDVKVKISYLTSSNLWRATPLWLYMHATFVYAHANKVTCHLKWNRTSNKHADKQMKHLLAIRS